jgi:hypothetical protein
MICLFGLSAGVQRNTNVYIEPSKRDWIAPRRAIFSSAHQPSSQGTFNQGGFNTSQWKKFYPRENNFVTFWFSFKLDSYLKVFHHRLKAKETTFITLQPMK